MQGRPDESTIRKPIPLDPKCCKAPLGWSLRLDSAGAVGLVVSMTAASRTLTRIVSD